MKKCPFCAEEIQPEAIKCRYCGEFLSPVSSIIDEEVIPSAPPTVQIDEYLHDKPSRKYWPWVGLVFLVWLGLFEASRILPEPAEPKAFVLTQSEEILLLPYTLEIILDEMGSENKRTVKVRLSERLSEPQLRSLARLLTKDMELPDIFTTLFAFYLPGMKVGDGAWAASRFTSSRHEILMFGFSKEELDHAQATYVPGDHLGRWIDDQRELGIVTIYQRSGSFFAETTYKDGSNLTEGLLVMPSSGGQRFDIKNNRSKEHYVINEIGNLEVGDLLGVFRTLRSIPIADTIPHVNTIHFPIEAGRAKLRMIIDSDTDTSLLTSLEHDNLYSLEFMGNAITNDTLGDIRDLTALQDLSILTDSIGSEGFAHLVRFAHLKRLSLRGVRLDAAAIAQIAKLTSLVELDLRDSHATDSAVTQLSTLTNLKVLQLPDTVSSVGFLVLEGALPDCDITPKQ